MKRTEVQLEKLLSIHSAEPKEEMKENWNEIPPIKIFKIPEQHILKKHFDADYLIADGMKRYATAKKYHLKLKAIIIEEKDEHYKEDLEITMNLARNYYGDYINW